MEAINDDGKDTYHDRHSRIAGGLPAENIGGVFAAILGGETGGILCDIECNATNNKKRGDYEENGKYGNLFDYGKLKRAWTIPRRIVLAMFLILIPLDYFLELGICKEVMAQEPAMCIAGTLIFLLTCVIGRGSPHRTFTHSILYVLLFSTGIYFISPMMALPALVGGFSHLLIDMLNNKGIQIFYPFKWKKCLHIFKPDKTANTVFMWAGLGADIFLINLFVMTYILPMLA